MEGERLDASLDPALIYKVLKGLIINGKPRLFIQFAIASAGHRNRRAA
jgi:hypothetical protein